jgi:hypothetical protein
VDLASHESQLDEVGNLTEDFVESHLHRERSGLAATHADQANADHAVWPHVDELDVGVVSLEEGRIRLSTVSMRVRSIMVFLTLRRLVCDWGPRQWRHRWRAFAGVVHAPPRGSEPGA